MDLLNNWSSFRLCIKHPIETFIVVTGFLKLSNAAEVNSVPYYLNVLCWNRVKLLPLDN